MKDIDLTINIQNGIDDENIEYFYKKIYKENNLIWFTCDIINENIINFYNLILTKYNIIQKKDIVTIFVIFQLYSKCHHISDISNYNLIISLYDEQNLQRSIELLYCLSVNLTNINIIKIHVLFEKNNTNSLIRDVIDFFTDPLIYHNFGFKSTIITVIYITEKPTYNYIFDYCNKNIIGNVIISNSDIIYDNTLNKISLDNDIFIVVSRKNKKLCNEWKLIDLEEHKCINVFSQDAWIFISPLTYILNVNYKLGDMHCDSYLNYILSKSNYKTYNLANIINCYHIQENESLNELIYKDIKLQKVHKQKLWDIENGNTDCERGIYISQNDDYFNKINYNKFTNFSNYIKNNNY